MFHASDAAMRSRLASRSLDLRRILPAAALADSAPPNTPGAARRGGVGTVPRQGSVPRAAAAAAGRGTAWRRCGGGASVWGGEVLAAHPA